MGFGINLECANLQVCVYEEFFSANEGEERRGEESVITSMHDLDLIDAIQPVTASHLES